LGQALAEKFSVALSNSSDKFSVARPGRMSETLKQSHLPQSNLHDIATALWVARELQIQAVLAGKITLVEDSLEIAVDCYRVDSGKWFYGLKTSSAISGDMRDLMNKIVESPASQLDPTFPVAGKSGYTYPSCVRCPPVQSDGQTSPNDLQGKVILSAVITVDGSVENFVVVNAAPNALTAKAVETVKA
jgi:hypothetical protein